MGDFLWTRPSSPCHTRGITRPDGLRAGSSPKVVALRRELPWFSLLPNLAVLAVVVAVGLAVVLGLRWWLRQDAGDSRAEADRGDWERMLAACKNLRDQGVLSEEEFRKLGTIAGPRQRAGMPDLRARHRPSTGSAGPEQARE